MLFRKFYEEIFHCHVRKHDEKFHRFVRNELSAALPICHCSLSFHSIGPKNDILQICLKLDSKVLENFSLNFKKSVGVIIKIMGILFILNKNNMVKNLCFCQLYVKERRAPMTAYKASQAKSLRKVRPKLPIRPHPKKCVAYQGSPVSPKITQYFINSYVNNCVFELIPVFTMAKYFFIISNQKQIYKFDFSNLLTNQVYDSLIFQTFISFTYLQLGLFR